MKKDMNCSGEPRNIIEEEVCGLYKGNLRLAVLRCLKEGSKETETIVERLTDLTDGEWSPNPSSVEEVLKDFKNFGLVISKGSKGTKKYQFTEKGRRLIPLSTRGSTITSASLIGYWKARPIDAHDSITSHNL